MPDHSSTRDDTPARRRGRPVQIDHETRETMVLDAVIELLMQCRLEDISMSGIARKAGMSKRTLYTIFASREELLGATFARIGRTLFRPLSAADKALPLCDRLGKILTVNYAPTFEQAPLELLRAVVAEAPIYPGIAREMDGEGRGALIRYVAAELREEAAAGALGLHDMTAEEAAELLVDMVMGDALHRLLRPDLAIPDPAAKALRRQRAIRLFLDGLRPV